MTAQSNIISQIRGNLKRCGYSDPLLRENYAYGDGKDTRTVPLAAFASPVHDSRTSCIAVNQSEKLLQIAAEDVYQFKGLGAPVVFVPYQQDLQWWTIRPEKAEYLETIASSDINGFFEKHKSKFAPECIWRAKNIGRVTGQQLNFVDIGLMPLLEEEMGERLGGLMNRVIDKLHQGFIGKKADKAENQRWTFKAGFWLLCAKILKDKGGVNGFVRLDLNDVGNVLKAVENHYRANPKELVIVQTEQQTQALKEAAEEIKRFASLSNLTTESFAYMYENVLVDENLRDALGIHATPSYLVDYIVWQLWPWIEQIPEDKRIVLEPACGHAPFLTGAMRLLRELFKGNEKEFHGYAKKHLIGIEKDTFAREIARLSLTLADVPNPNGWNIIESDIYQGNILSKKAKEATILLCNPPFEDFTPTEQNAYKKACSTLNFFNKAAEMLWRTLPYMREHSVFGVVLPRGFLDKKNITDVRKMIINDFEIQQICRLPKGVFRYANHESVVLCGRKTRHAAQKKHYRINQVLYRHVPKGDLLRFREKYEARDQYVQQLQFIETSAVVLKRIELSDIWEYLRKNYPILESIVSGGKGFEHKGIDLPKGAKTYDKTRFAGAVRGYVLFNDDIKIHGLPDKYWVNIDPTVIRRPGFGMEIGRPQILMNYAPVSEDPWRLKVLIDKEGLPVSSRFLIFRPKNEKWLLNVMWAILNNPLANAFIYAHTTDRDIAKGTAKEIPIPLCSGTDREKLHELVSGYFRLMATWESKFAGDILDKAKRVLLSIDAEVMRLYDLPPKMEKRILDLFQGKQRKGVDFEFKGYYPEGFESAIPLHEYLSEEYQRSTVEFVEKWVEANRSPEVIKALENAVEAFEEE